MLISYEGSFDQEVFPHVGCRGPQLDFFVTADSKNCIDLNRICLSLEVTLYKPNGTDRLNGSENIIFANNTLHSLFSHVELFLNEKLISSSSNNYHRSAFVETELSTDTTSTGTWARCQRYQYRGDKIMNDEIKAKIVVKNTSEGKCSVQLYGAPHIDFLECERLLLPGVTLHLRFYRSPNLCAMETLTTLNAADVKDLEQNPTSVTIEKASLFVNKTVLSDAVKVSIERALSKSRAVYPYIECLTKSFLVQAGQNCFVKENIFGTEPIRRLTLCMVRNRFFRGTTLASTSFRYEKFSLQKVELQRGNGLPIAGTPLDTTNNSRLYYNVYYNPIQDCIKTPLTALGFERSGNGITLDEY